MSYGAFFSCEIHTQDYMPPSILAVLVVRSTWKGAFHQSLGLSSGMVSGIPSHQVTDHEQQDLVKWVPAKFLQPLDNMLWYKALKAYRSFGPIRMTQ